MKSYSSFLIRCWLLPDSSQGEQCVFNIEHVQSGERRRAERLIEAEEWMLDACRCHSVHAGHTESPDVSEKQSARE